MSEGAGGEGMGCKHETHLVRELGEVGEGEVEDGVLAADEDGSRVRVQELEEVGRGPPRRRRRKAEPQTCERKRRRNITDFMSLMTTSLRDGCRSPISPRALEPFASGRKEA